VPPPKAIPQDVFDAIMSGSSPAGILSADECVALTDLYALEAASGVYKLRGKPRATADVERYYALAELAVSVFQRAELPEVRHSITSSEVHYGALDRLQEPTFRYFYFRDPSVTDSIPPPWASDYREPHGSPAERHLEELKARVKDPQTKARFGSSPVRWWKRRCHGTSIHASGTRKPNESRT